MGQLKDIGITDVDIIVLPGAGRFIDKNHEVYKATFKRNLAEYLSILAIKLTNIVLSILSKKPRSIYFYIDLSHGLNYHPSLTLSTIYDIAKSIAVFIEEVKLIIFNSEPYPTRELGDTPPKLKIHKILEYDILPDYTCYKAPSERDVFSGIRRTVDYPLKLVEHVNTILASISSVYPLTIIHSLSEYIKTLAEYYAEEFSPLLVWKHAEKTLNKLHEYYQDGVKVHGKTNELIVESNIDLHRFMKVYELSLAYILTCLASQVFEDIINTYREKGEVTIEELEHIVKILCRERYMLKDRIIGRDLEDIIEKIKEKIRKGTDLEELNNTYIKYLYVPRQEPISKPKFNHFQAHSGLEGNVTILKIVDPKSLIKALQEQDRKLLKTCIALGYDLNRLNQIYNEIRKALKSRIR